jgi:L-ascorbate metabolism protein UlaG (beta-lactamase superfamily)
MARNRYYTGPVSDHFDGRIFLTPGGVGPKGLRALLKWQFASEKAKWPAAFPSPHADAPPATVDGDDVRVSFIGHASYLVQGRGRALLIDPVYGERAGPLGRAGPKRVNAPGIAFDALPKIDAVVVTHNHYDHMCMTTLKRLHQRHRPRVITPLGNDAILRRAIPGLSVTTVDWHQSVDLGGGFALDAVPTQHWSARHLRDRCHALWASFVLHFGDKAIYAVGDSGFGDGRIFRAVGARYRRLDLALLPIGAYEPRWFMRDQHMNPDDAVQALQLCGARRAIGHHWGTFQLTNEPIEAPAQHLAEALSRHAVTPERFVALRPGAVHTV